MVLVKQNKQNRKSRKNTAYFKYIGFLILCLGIALILTSAYIILSPYIFGNSFLSPLPKNSQNNSVDIKSLLSRQKINVSSVSIATDSSYLVYLTDGGTVIMSTKRNLEEQVRSLQIILSRLTIEGKRFKNLDFRFDKPVVSF